MTKFATILNSKKTISATLTFAVALLILVVTLFASGNLTPQTTAAAVTLKTSEQIESPVVETLETKAKAATQKAELAEKAEAAAKGQAIGSGQASFYGPGFAGRPTANGETFNPSAMTAAHKTLPFGTKVKVTNLNNGKSVVVRINDRGPFVGHRIIDLSQGAASKIGMVASGTAKVKLEKIA